MSQYVILDTRGALLRDYHGSSYKSIQDGDKQIPSWQDGLAAFIDKTLWPLLDNYAPRQVICCFDGGNNFRRQLYPDYKQKRRDKDIGQELVKQTDELQKQAKRLLAYLGCRVVWVPGEEADDLISLFCERLEASSILVLSYDADLLQLVDARVSVQRDGRLYSYNGYGQTELDGLPLKFIRLHKSICGDSSDGYPGVRGAGPKFFEELRAVYGDDGLEQLEALVKARNYAPLQGQSDRWLKKLGDQWAEWELSYALASLHPKACYGAFKGVPKRPQWYVRVPDQWKVMEILKQLHLEQVMTRVAHWMPSQELFTADRAQELVNLMPEILASSIVSYDFESSDKMKYANLREADPKYVDVLSQELAGISINFGKNLERTIYIPFDHANTANLDKDWARWILSSLDSRSEPCVVQNANFELSVAKTDLGLTLKAPYDTAVIASYADENDESNLKTNSLSWLNYTQATYKEVTQGRDMCELTGDEVLSYGCDDSLVTSHLFDVKRHIMQIEGSWAFYRNYEVAPVSDDVATFIAGTDVDLVKMQELREDAASRVMRATAAIHEALAEYCNSGDTDAITQCAHGLLQEWWSTDQYSYEKKTPAEAQAAYQRLWKKAWEGCFYVAPETRVDINFIATPAQLNSVLTLIDPLCPLVTAATSSGVDKWSMALDHYLSKQVAQEDQLRQFQGYLTAAKRSLAPAGRSGTVYLRLVEFCKSILARFDKGKVIVSGDHLNMNSSPQMQCLLYGKLRLPVRKRSKVIRGTLRDKKDLKGPPATGLKAIAAALVYDVLEQDDWRMPVLLNYREVALLQQEESLYYKKYPLLVHPRDGRLHPQFKNCGTTTRRPTGSAPNDLQVSKKDGAKIRKCYVGGDYGDGKRIYVSADFANQEVVITACEAREPTMLHAFMSSPRQDIHTLTSTGFADLLLHRLGFDFLTKLTYEQFSGMLRDKEHPELMAAAKEIRNKYAKACVAEGSLVLTDRGLVPIEAVELSDLVWDGIEWVSHDGVVCRGIKEVITYDGVTATPDHEVLTDDGRKVQIGILSSQQAGSKIAIGEVDGSPIRFSNDRSSSVSEGEQKRGLLEEEVCGRDAMHGMRKGGNERRGQPAVGEVIEVPLPEQPHQVSRPENEDTKGAVRSDESAMHKQELEVLQELRGPGDREQVLISGQLHFASDDAPATPNLPRGADRQEGQRGALRDLEPETGYSSREFMQQTDERHSQLPGNEHPSSTPMACDKASSLGISPLPEDGGKEMRRWDASRGDSKSPKEEPRRARVYDIVNAGPRHRFTVSGRIVGNCNFLIIYGGGYTTLAENLLIPAELAKELMNSTFGLYRRLQPWQQEVIEFAKTHGYTQTAYGNRRHATKDLYSADSKLSKHQERQLINYTIQGCAADLLKLVRQEMHNRDFLGKYHLKAIKPVYDEISASVPIELAADYAQELAEVMTITPPGYPVGMKVDLSIGHTWGSVEEVDNDRTALDNLILRLKEEPA